MKNKLKLAAIIGGMAMSFAAIAQKPVIQTKYTADPAPMVYNDTVFLYHQSR